MPPIQTPSQDEQSDADVRLALIRTQAVGIVDRAANGELFLALKSMNVQTPPTAPPPAEAQKAPGDPAPEPAPAAPSGPIKLPGATKTALVAVLGSLLEHLTEAATLVQGAEVDDAAEPMPAPLLAHLLASDDALDEALGPYEIDDEMMAAPSGASMLPPGADASQKAAPPPAPDAASSADASPKKPKPRMALKRLAQMAAVHKALAESCQKLGEHIAWAQGPAMAPPPAGSMAPVKKGLDPYTEMTATASAVRDRMYCIRDLLESDPAKVAAELRGLIPMVDNLAALVTQARTGTMAEQATGATATLAPTKTAEPPALSEEAVQKAVVAALSDVKADLIASVHGELSGLVLAAKTAAAKAQATLAKVEKSVPAPNAQPAGEIPAIPTGAPPPADPWREAQKEIQETSQARRPAAGK